MTLTENKLRMNTKWKLKNIKWNKKRIENPMRGKWQRNENPMRGKWKWNEKSMRGNWREIENYYCYKAEWNGIGILEVAIMYLGKMLVLIRDG